MVEVWGKPRCLCSVEVFSPDLPGSIVVASQSCFHRGSAQPHPSRLTFILYFHDFVHSHLIQAEMTFESSASLPDCSMQSFQAQISVSAGVFSQESCGGARVSRKPFEAHAVHDFHRIKGDCECVMNIMVIRPNGNVCETVAIGKIVPIAWSNARPSIQSFVLA